VQEPRRSLVVGPGRGVEARDRVDFHRKSASAGMNRHTARLLGTRWPSSKSETGSQEYPMRERNVRSLARRCAAITALVATLGMAATEQAAAQAYWRSGMSCYYGNMLPILESWRGTPFSALHGWAPQDLSLIHI